jgi:hypothetical protein
LVRWRSAETATLNYTSWVCRGAHYRYAPGVTELKFVKSSFCGSGACVEVAFVKSSFSCSDGCVEVDRTSASPDILVRDSKDPSIAPMRFTADEWQAFTAGVKAGEFDLYGLGGVDGLV